MAPTKEQLADPKWWREKAPLGATHAAFRNQEDITWYKGIASNGCMVWNPSENTWVWCLGSPVHGPLIERPTQPQWTGPEDGLPPVGAKCRVVGNYYLCGASPLKLNDGDVVRVIGHADYGYGEVCVIADESNNGGGTMAAHGLRPIRTQAEIERDKLVAEAVNEHAPKGSYKEHSMMAEFARNLYDAGMLRKPMSRFEFEALFNEDTEFDRVPGRSLKRIYDALGYKD